MKRILFGLILLSLIFPVISADLIVPGYHPITVTNQITNIDEFPDYVFVSGPWMEGGIGMCPLKLIEEDGKISSHYYKFCVLSVYAIPKEKFDLEEFEQINSAQSNDEDFKNYLNSVDAKEVIKNIDVHKEVPDSSVVEEENNFYNIDLEKVKVEPDEVDEKINYLIIIYILIPLIALIFIIIILVRRGK